MLTISDLQCSVRGRRLKGKAKESLGAGETRGAREEAKEGNAFQEGTRSTDAHAH